MRHLILYELVPGLAGLNKDLLRGYSGRLFVQPNLLKTSQLCSVEIFKDISNDVFIVAAQKQPIQNALGLDQV